MVLCSTFHSVTCFLPPINGSFLMFARVDTGSRSLFIFIAVMEENTTVYLPILLFGEHLDSLVLL